jgi:hypothetical protein
MAMLTIRSKSLAVYRRPWSGNPRIRSFVGGFVIVSFTDIISDDREVIDLAVLVFVGKRCECVPFEQGPGRKLETIAGFHGAVFEVEADNMIKKDFRVDVAAMKCKQLQSSHGT